MPEGPSIVILKEAAKKFEGHKVKAAAGNTRNFDPEEFQGKILIAVKSWGKHSLLCFPDKTIRIHFLLFGSYRVDEKKENAAPRLHFTFSNGEINFYASSVKIIEEPLDEIYDWSADVMNPIFDKKAALAKLRSQPETLICDALLNQEIFAGVGNIIKNETLFRMKIHPESKTGKIPPARLKALVEDAVDYSFCFLKWKKEYVLKENWQAHRKKICPRDNVPYVKENLGKTNRKAYYCTKCQKLYS